MTDGLKLMNNLLTPLAKSVLISSGLTAAESATKQLLRKKIFGSGTTALIASNKEMKDIMKVVKYLELSVLLKKDINKAIKNESK